MKVWSSKKGLFHIYNTKASIHELVNFNILALKRIAIMYRAGLWHLFSIKVNSFTDSFFIVEKELFVLCRIFSKEQVQFSNLFCSWICKQLQGEAWFSPGHFTHRRFVQCPGINIREIAKHFNSYTSTSNGRSQNWYQSCNKSPLNDNNDNPWDHDYMRIFNFAISTKCVFGFFSAKCTFYRLKISTYKTRLWPPTLPRDNKHAQ